MLNLGDTFTYSIWARLSDEETKTNIKAQITADGTLNGQNSIFIDTRNSMGGDSIISKTWKRFYYTFTVPAERLSENNGSITLTRFEQNISSSDNCYVMWAAPKLERGSKPTDWSPAPEDVDIDEIEIGGRNYLLNSSKYREDKPWTINNTTANDSIIEDHTLRIYFEQNQEYIIQVKSDGDVANSHGYRTDNIGKFTLWLYERYIDSEKDESHFDCPRCFHKLVNNNTQKYLGNKGNTYYWYYKCPSNVRDACIRMNTYADTENPVTIHFWDLKIERGNKPTDWTPPVEDIDATIAKTVKTVDVEYYLSTSSSTPTGGSWSTTAPEWTNGKYMWSRQKVTYVDNTNDTRNQTCIAGSIGQTGTGIDSITEEYYLSTSKTSQNGGSWVTTPPTWQSGKYIWTRSKIVYKNPASIVYTEPICSSEWEAINNISIGGKNLMPKSKTFMTPGYNSNAILTRRNI